MPKLALSPCRLCFRDGDPGPKTPFRKWKNWQLTIALVVVVAVLDFAIRPTFGIFSD